MLFSMRALGRDSKIAASLDVSGKRGGSPAAKRAQEELIAEQLRHFNANISVMYAGATAGNRADDPRFGGESLTHSVPARIAVVIEGVALKGHIVSNQDMIVEGEVEGTIEMREHSLIVASTGSVRGDVNAREVVVVGSIHGDVEAVDRICICREASVIGNIRTAAIEIEDGGYIQGGIACCKIGEVLGVRGSSRTRFLYDAPEALEFSPAGS